MALEPAVAEAHAVAVDRDGDRLTDRARIVADRQVLHREVVGVDDEGGRAKGPDRLAVEPLHAGVQPVDEDRASGSSPTSRTWRFSRWT